MSAESEPGDGPEITAPDFYRYRWQPLVAATLAERFVTCRWADGLEMAAYDLWLRENAVGPSVDPTTRECVIDPADLDPAVVAARTVEVDANGTLVVHWQDETTTTHHPGWLRHVADGAHRAEAWLPRPVPWLARDLGDGPPTHDGSEPDTRPAVVARWVEDLTRYGVARLRGLGTELDTVGRVAELIGPMRDTNFGLTWDVKAAPEPDTTANTTHRLAPHTDLPTRELPPGFQFLHCVANTVDGGWSTMADGMAVVEHLADDHPEHYEALTTLRWVFFNRGPAVDHRWSGPIIDDIGGTLTLRAFHPVRGFPDMDPDDVPRAYAALRCFSSVAAADRFQLRFPFRPGDLVGFDNRRILHGRDGYASAGLRHLRGCYLDHDDLYSYARQQARARAARLNQ